MSGPAGFMADLTVQSQCEVNEIMAGMENVYAEWARHLEESAPRCHFTPMEWNMDDGDGESWWECKHCGHTKTGEPA